MARVALEQRIEREGGHVYAKLMEPIDHNLDNEMLEKLYHNVKSFSIQKNKLRNDLNIIENKTQDMVEAFRKR